MRAPARKPGPGYAGPFGRRGRAGLWAAGLASAWAATSAVAQTTVPADAPIAVPSGQEVRYLDTVQAAPGTEGLTIRFRFVAPAIARDGGTIDPATAQGDMEALCNSFALPRLPAVGPQPGQIVISLSDREVAFGEPAPEVTQFFEAYVVEDSRCVWEPF